MSVTVIYQGQPLTFPDIDDPSEAYKRLGASTSGSSSRLDPWGSSTNQTSVDNISTKNVPKGIDPKMLKDNQDWLTASKVLFERSQGRAWTGSNAELADWGLDRMARFSYNMPLMGVDAATLKNAPDDQKKAFMFMLDSFDKVAYSWGGVANFAKYAAIDPTNYVGLATFGVGTAAAQAAKLTTKEGVKAALKTGVFGALEGATFGAANSYLEQTARTNAGGQAEVDAGHVALGAAAGGAAGAVLAPLAAVGMNRLFAKEEAKIPASEAARAVEGDATKVATPTEPAQPYVEPKQLDLGLGDPSQDAYKQLNLIDNLPYERRLDQLPEGLRPPVQETMSDMTDRLSEKWGVDHQQKLDLGPPVEGPYAHAGQGELFPTDPDKFVTITPAVDKFNEPIRFPKGHPRAGEVMTEEVRGSRINMIDDVLDNNTPRFNDPVESVKTNTKNAEKSVPPAPTERIGAENGPTLAELRRLLNDIGSRLDNEAVRAWTMLSSVTDPLRRALVHMTPDEAKELAKAFGETAMTNSERRAFVDSTINAQNQVAQYIKYHSDMLAQATTDALKGEHTQRILEGEKILSPLKLLAKEAGSISGSTLANQAENMFKGKLRDIDVSEILRRRGVDPALASDAERVSAVEELVNGIVSASANVEKDTRILDLRKKIGAAVDTDEQFSLWQEMATLRQQIADEEYARASMLEKGGLAFKKITGDIASFTAMTVLGPSSVMVNTISNGFRVFSRPFLNYLAKGPLEQAAFKEMLQTYGAFRSVALRSLQVARLSMDLNSSILSGTENKWLERNMSRYGKEGENNAVRFMNRNFVQIWMRMLNATDEMFQQMAYHGYVEGTAAFKAYEEAAAKSLGKTETNALVKSKLEEALTGAYNTKPDATVVGMLREAGIQKGLQGEELKLFVQNQITNNQDLLKRAHNEEGISYVNDLLFKSQFSGETGLSRLAQGYEKIVQEHPTLKLAGQLFFRTPVRVFEAGMRMTPFVQFMPGTRFTSDLMGANGAVRQLRARSELVASYGFSMAVVTGFSNGTITGSGYNLDYRERRNLENAGWKPYSIKFGDTYVSYRNLDPFSTPIKIVVNALERLQRVDYEKAQGVYEQKNDMSEILGYLGVATGSVIQAIRDASLTSGIDDVLKLGEALADPDRKEHAFLQLFQSKAQLVIPNAIRKGVVAFGDGQNVANDPATYDQVMSAIINPSSERVTHQYDALGFKRTGMTQGLMPYLGLDIEGKESRERGLSDKEIFSLTEIAKMSFATGKRFIPSPKTPLYPDKDLREVMSADGVTTVYNKAMAEFNKNMPAYAYSYLKSSEGLASGHRGEVGKRAEGFEKIQNNIWKSAIATAINGDSNAVNARLKKQQGKFDVLTGAREVPAPL